MTYIPYTGNGSGTFPDTSLGEGYSYDPQAAGKISTLEDLGIASISLESTISSTIDIAGNTEIRSGHFEWQDGSSSTIADYSLQRDTGNTLPTEVLAVSPAIGGRPELNGHGTIRSLRQATVLDSSGELDALYEAFVSEPDTTNREAIFQQLLFKWTEVDDVAPDSRGQFIDARRVVLLEKYFGQSWGSPDRRFAVACEDTYREIFEGYYAALTIQTHLLDLYQKITQTSNIDTGRMYDRFQ